MTDSPTLSVGPPPVDREPRPACGNRVYLPTALVAPALAAQPGDGYGPDDVQRQLRCGLEKHHDGAHHGFVRELAGADTGSVWTRWRAGEVPDAVVVLADCDGRSADGMDVCEEFAGHPGGHTWQLDDPWRDSPA